ncbi:amidase signature domain-containing protein [Aspergillus karnatakaensis]|uniref:amidase signature domain-containing protein n=1 Tax=Aspergillus karnatakaensis TaxID=1810916 RepID=UPI003CCCC131
MSTAWKDQARKAQNILDQSIPKQWIVPTHLLPPPSQLNVVDFPRKSGLLTDKELALTGMSATALVAAMGEGRASAEEVVVAFLKRSVIAHQLVNFATEFMADKAISRARELDKHFKETGKLVGPLHGVPISVKEHVGIKGLTLNAGYATWVDDIATEDALLLQCLGKAGAVFHVRTNQPQALMHLCCENNLTGTSLNPFNRTLTPGGSSGGEGVSAGLACAPLGIGTDIGGSIRCPAAFCNGYGFRPTARRNPLTGLKSPAPGQEAILSVVGPLASQSIEDLDLFQRAVLDQEPWDVETSLAPVPWKRVSPPTNNIRIAIMWDDGCVRPHPPVMRALKYAREKLQAAGVQLVDWKPYKHDHGWDIISSMYFPDAAASQRALAAQTGEPILPLTEWAFQFSRPTPLTVADSWKLNYQRDVYRDEYHALIKSRGIDFILCPAYVGAAAVLGESHYWNYTAIWNILDHPAAVFPSGLFVDPKLDGVDVSYQPRSALDEREWKKYAPERYYGAPIGLQIAGKHFKDEDTLAAAKFVTEMFFKALDLTTALRPLLLPDETLLFVQDAVGLYEGKYKVPNYQNGHAYLTSHRVCYVAAGFFKSSPKISIYPKPLKNVDRSRSSGASPARSLPLRTQVAGTQSSLSPTSAPSFTPPAPNLVNATWVCPICSFSNPVPSNFDPSAATNSTPIPPCLACGIKPPFTTILKAAIAAATSREPPTSAPATPKIGRESPVEVNGHKSTSVHNTSVTCPRCTFSNHPSLLECEICGASLLSVNPARNPGNPDRAESPAPIFEEGNIRNSNVSDHIKLSFRVGGDKIFLERLKGALIQRKWLLYDAPPPPPQPVQPQPISTPDPTGVSTLPAQTRSPGVGIAGLERRGLEARKNNEVVIGNAFEDLEALMASAKQIVALAETLARESGMASGETSAETNAVLSESAAALGMVTTKDMLGSSANNLYLSELSRNLAEYLTDDRKGILQREGGIMSLIDLWAVFNRSRNGVELVSPSDFQKAAELWEKLKLPVRLRRFKSGLMVVQRYDWSDEKTIRRLQDWMADLRAVPPPDPVPWDWRLFGRPITAQETAQRFGWSVGVAAEELEMAEDKGVFCRDEGIEGLKFWTNYITFDPTPDDTDDLAITSLDL